MKIRYRIKRLKIKAQNKRKRTERKRAESTMNYEQKQVFQLVVDLSKKYPESIKYDRVEKETMLVLPTVLITMKTGDSDYTVHVDNHSGFHTQPFDPTAFSLLNDLVDVEAHRYRRKLKYEVKLNIREFINNVKGPET